MASEEEIKIEEKNTGDINTGAKKMTVRLDSFEGPFDLLLTLLEKQKLEITDIPISTIADQYLDIIFAAGGFNVEVGSEFLVMASGLIHMKTRKLLPPPLPETDEMTEEQLTSHLLLYKQYKQAAEEMAGMMDYWSNARYREQENIEFPKKQEILEISAEKLAECYDSAKLRFETLRNDNTEKMQIILKSEKVSLKDKIRQVIHALTDKIKVKFSDLFSKEKNSKPEIVTGFLAILELNRRENVKLKQHENFGEIEITRIGDSIDENGLNLEGYDEWT